MPGIFDQTAHRPWPLPGAPWVMSQTWHTLLFAHWPVDLAALRERVPAALEIDTHAGQAWLGVVPFGMRRVRPRGAFPLPGLSDFLELNLRTYVRSGGRPGVYFFSLDAASPAAVAVARLAYHLPYYHARMTLRHRDGWVEYHSHRTHRGAPAAELRGRYRPAGEVYHARQDSLEHWLTERYCLYALDGRGRLYRGEIHHIPWPLQPAQAEFEVNSLAEAAGLPGLGGSPPQLLHFAREIETAVWALRRISGELPPNG